MKKINRYVQNLVRTSLSKRGFVFYDMLKNWQWCVGNNFASLIKPEKIQSGYKNTYSTLYVRLISSSYAPIIEQQKDLIIDKINTFYGYKAINDIKLIHYDISSYGKNKITKSNTRENVPQDINNIEILPQQQKIIDNIKSDAIKKQLATLIKYNNKKNK